MDTQLAGSIGDRLGAGIQQGVAAFAAGIERKRAKEEEKRKNEAALGTLKKFGARIPALKDLSDEDWKAGMEGMGGPSGVTQLAMQIDQAEQQQKLMAARTKEIEAQQKEQEVVKASLPEVLAQSAAGATETGEWDFDPQKFISGMTAKGVSPDTALKYAQVFARNPGAAVQFIQNPQTGQAYAQLGQTLIREPDKTETARKEGDTVMDEALGREIIWATQPYNRIDKKTGQPIYQLRMDPQTGDRVLTKNPAVWGPAGAPGKVTIPENLFGNVNF